MRVLLVLVLLARAGTGQRPVEEFPGVVSEMESRRLELSRQWKRAGTEEEKNRIRAGARGFVVQSMLEKIFPPWMGTPWHMGEDDDASMPHQKGKRVSCSMFVTAVLQNAGLKLDDRKRWADSRALYIQRSLAPEPKNLHRYFSITPKELARKLGRLKPGLYLIGLNCHVGFVVIGKDDVRFVHSNYVDPAEGVVDEPLAESQAVKNSQPVGYWVTPLFQDDRLIEFWLEGRPVPINREFKVIQLQPSSSSRAIFNARFSARRFSGGSDPMKSFSFDFGRLTSSSQWMPLGCFRPCSTPMGTWVDSPS